MTDSRYTPYAQYAQPYPYATSGLGQGHPQRSYRDTPSHPSQSYSQSQSYAANGYARTDAPSLPGHSQAGYPPSSSRHRTSSMNTNAPMLSQSSASALYGNPPMLPGGHPRGHSQHYGSPPDSMAHSGATYMAAQPHELQADYIRSGTPLMNGSPDYYYAQSVENPSPPRPFPCDLCALSFNRAHDLKVCLSFLNLIDQVCSSLPSVIATRIQASGHFSAMAVAGRPLLERMLSNGTR